MWSFKRFHPVDARANRPLLEQPGELDEEAGLPRREDFHRAVRAVSDPAAKPEALGVPGDEPPEPDPLHHALHEEPACHGYVSGCARMRRRWRTTYRTTTSTISGNTTARIRPT